MKKIGICTITILVENENAYNYGNKLQTYALQEYLRNKGYFPDTIRYIFRTPPFVSTSTQRSSSSLEQFFDDVLRVCKRKFLKKKLAHFKGERIKKFNSFVKNNISYTEEIYQYDSDFSALAQSYDCFITGSDQVWNPYCEGSNPFYFLNFAPKGKRIAYAPSIAVNDIPQEIESEYGDWVKGIDSLSIREDSGKKLLEDKYGLNAKLVCDPVFLLTEKEWDKVSAEPKVKDKYFLVYILGKKSVQTKKYIAQFEQKTGLKAIDVYTRDDPNSYFAGPEEFVGLIKNAEFVFTDSFHGTAFSVIYKKPMVIVERDAQSSSMKMNSRIDSLLKLLDFKKRSCEDIINDLSLLPVNYHGHTDKLERLIKESKEYLMTAISKAEEQ